MRSATARHQQDSIFRGAASNVFNVARIASGTAIAPVYLQSINALIGQGVFMKRILFVLVALGLFSAGIVGCRAEGEVGTTSSVSIAR